MMTAYQDMLNCILLLVVFVKTFRIEIARLKIGVLNNFDPAFARTHVNAATAFGTWYISPSIVIQGYARGI
jgi:hypothetical protein